MTTRQRICKHITSRCRAAFTLWGAANVVELDDGIQFKANTTRRCYVRITLVAATGRYTVSFGVIRNKTWVEAYRRDAVELNSLFAAVDEYIS